MAKYKLKDVYSGEKYNIEAEVYAEVLKLIEKGYKTTDIKLNMLYVKHAFIISYKMLLEGDSISDIPELKSPSLYNK